MFERGAWRLALALVMVAGLAPIQAQTVAPAPGSTAAAQQSLPSIRSKVRALIAQQRLDRESEAEACANADAQDVRLAESEETSGPQLKQLVDMARLHRQRCKDAGDKLSATRKGLEAVQAELREVALAATGAVAVVAAAPASAAQSLAVRAAAAQGKVDAQRTEVVDAYPLADKAARQALLQAEVGASQAAALAGQAQDVMRNARRSRSAAQSAQSASNDMVRAALDVVKCKQADTDCQAAELRALAAEARLKQQLDNASDAYTKAKLGAYGIDASARYPGMPAEQATMVTMLRTLDAYPDARSLFGPESYRLSASTAGSRASIKIGLDRLFGAGQAQTSLILSTPAAKQGRSSLIDSVDGLASAATLELGHTFVKGIGLKDDVFSGFRALGVSATVGQDRREYRELQDLSGVTELSKLPDLRSRNTVPWGLSVYGSLAAADGTFLHLFKASAQRSYKDQDESIACPVPIPGDGARFNCVSARFGAPRAETARVFSYEARWKWKDGALSARISHNDKRHVTELEVPIYLIRSADDKKGGSFNGGINLGWSSKTGGQVGLFVDAPFSMFGLD